MRGFAAGQILVTIMLINLNLRTIAKFLRDEPEPSRTAFAKSPSSHAEIASGMTCIRRPPPAIRSSTSKNEASWNHRSGPKRAALSNTAHRHPPPQTEESNALKIGHFRHLTGQGTGSCPRSWISTDDRAENNETLPRILRSVSLSGSS